MPDRNRIKVAQCVHDLFRMWSRVRLHEGNPVSITRMLTTSVYRESFIESCIVALGLEVKSGKITTGQVEVTEKPNLQRRSLENYILQELVGDRVLVLPEDQS